MSLLENVIQLGQTYGMTFENRSVSGSFVWNGKNLGLWWQKWQEDCLCSVCREGFADTFPSYAQMGVADSTETWLNKVPQLCSVRIDLSPADILHEVGHFIVCPEWTRDLPEYGLAILPGEYNANGGYHLHREDSRMEGLFEEDEQNKFEAMANLVGYILMARLEIRPPKEYTNAWVPTYKPDGYQRSESEMEDRSWCVAEMNNYGFSESETLAALRFHGANY